MPRVSPLVFLALPSVSFGDRPAVDLEPFAGQAALALELASGYTDALHAVRRRKDTQPAAEIQQNLLPPRMARVDRADLDPEARLQALSKRLPDPETGRAMLFDIVNDAIARL